MEARVDCALFNQKVRQEIPGYWVPDKASIRCARILLLKAKAFTKSRKEKLCGFSASSRLCMELFLKFI